MSTPKLSSDYYMLQAQDPELTAICVVAKGCTLAKDVLVLYAGALDHNLDESAICLGMAMSEELGIAKFEPDGSIKNLLQPGQSIGEIIHQGLKPAAQRVKDANKLQPYVDIVSTMNQIVGLSRGSVLMACAMGMFPNLAIADLFNEISESYRPLAITFLTEGLKVKFTLEGDVWVKNPESNDNDSNAVVE